MVRRLYTIWLIGFCSLSLWTVSACSPKAVPPMPELGVPTYNTHLKLAAPSGWNSFKIGDSISLRFEVIGDDNIAFDPRSGIILLALQDDQWIEIPNLGKYPGITGSFIYQPAQGDEFKKGSVSMRPNLSNYEKVITLRVILIGYVTDNNEVIGEKVAGYIDLLLKP